MGRGLNKLKSNSGAIVVLEDQIGWTVFCLREDVVSLKIFSSKVPIVVLNCE